MCLSRDVTAIRYAMKYIHNTRWQHEHITNHAPQLSHSFTSMHHFTSSVSLLSFSTFWFKSIPSIEESMAAQRVLQYRIAALPGYFPYHREGDECPLHPRSCWWLPSCAQDTKAAILALWLSWHSRQLSVGLPISPIGFLQFQTSAPSLKSIDEIVIN